MKNKVFFSLISIALMAALMSSNVSAAGQNGQYGQYGQYGGTEQPQNIIVDKTVSTNAKTKGGVVSFVDNLSPSDPRYSPGQNVSFRIKVKNTSNTVMENITVRDFVPTYLEPVEGPGSFDKNNRTISYTIARLNAGEEKTDTLTMQIVSQDKLPADKGLLCVVNKAHAGNNNASDEDTSQFCVEKLVTGVSQVPTAGPEMGLAMLAGSFATLASGFMLRKRS